MADAQFCVLVSQKLEFTWSVVGRSSNSSSVVENGGLEVGFMVRTSECQFPRYKQPTMSLFNTPVFKLYLTSFKYLKQKNQASDQLISKRETNGPNFHRPNVLVPRTLWIRLASEVPTERLTLWIASKKSACVTGTST